MTDLGPACLFRFPGEQPLPAWVLLTGIRSPYRKGFCKLSSATHAGWGVSLPSPSITSHLRVRMEAVLSMGTTNQGSSKSNGEDQHVPCVCATPPKMQRATHASSANSFPRKLQRPPRGRWGAGATANVRANPHNHALAELGPEEESRTLVFSPCSWAIDK